MKYFRGYLPTRNKRATEKFKGRTVFYSYEEIKDQAEFAGVLAEDVIVVDVDDKEQSEILYNIVKGLGVQCRIYQTTRGLHFLFRNNTEIRNGAGKRTAVGLTVDYKVGNKNAYEVLKIDWKERKILQDSDDPDQIPFWLYTMTNCPDFVNMEAGSGRNSELFSYILKLQNKKFSKEEIKETLQIINDFILLDPLTQTELDVIMRDEAFEKPPKATFDFKEFAKFMIKEYNLINLNGQIHIYRDGVYVSGTRDIEKAMTENIENSTRAKRREIMEYIYFEAKRKNINSDSNYIAFENGLFDVMEDEFSSFTPEIVVTNQIPWNYNPDAYSKLADSTLNKIACGDKEIRAVLEEMIGYCFYRKNELGKSFILTGDKSNGKSTYLDMVNNILGYENTSALDVKELNERFKLAEVYGKLANIGDDISDDYIPSTGVFKKLITGERLSAERKGADPFEFNNYSKMIFSANSVPRLGKGRDSEAIARRLQIIPFNATFSKNDPDFSPFIKYQLREKEVMEYLIILGIKGLQRVLKNNGFTHSNKIEANLLEYEKTNNPLLQFLDEIELDEIVNEETSSVYERYKGFVLANGLGQISNIEFSKQIKKIFDLEIVNKKINGKKCRIFVKEAIETWNRRVGENENKS